MPTLKKLQHNAVILKTMEALDKMYGEETKIPVTPTFKILGWIVKGNFIIVYHDATELFHFAHLQEDQFGVRKLRVLFKIKHDDIKTLFAVTEGMVDLIESVPNAEVM